MLTNQHLNQVNRFLCWLTALGWMGVVGFTSGCRPEVKPIPAVDLPTTPLRNSTDSSTSAANDKQSTAKPATPDAGEVAEKLMPSTPALPSSVAEPGNKPQPLPDEVGEAWLPAGTSLPVEYWEALYRNAQRIGVTRYRFEKHDRNRLRLTTTTFRPVTGVAQPINRISQVESIEQPGGQMESFAETDTVGSSQSKVEGAAIGRILRLEAKSPTGVASKQVALPAGSWGPMGIHQLLLRKPMKPNESRVAQIFLAQTHQVARVTLLAGQPEATTTPEGLVSDLIPIESFLQTEKEGIRVRMWADTQGRVYKTIWPAGLNFSSFRISADVGQRMVDETEVQLLAGRKIKVAEAFKQVDQLDQVVYSIGSSEADPYLLFSSETNQVVRSSTAYEAELTVVSAASSGSIAPRVRQSEPGPECTGASPYIDYEAPNVIQLAEVLTGDERVPEAVALKLNEGLFQWLRPHQFDVPLHRVSETVQLQKGDAVDYAMTLAALLRSRKIPARLASGIRLREVDGQYYFAYHMWTEAWVGSSWLALDPSTGQRAGCSYIKFLESPLEGSNPYRAMLPVLGMLDKLKITLKQ